jgi:small-conductance mechanosensitive channel
VIDALLAWAEFLRIPAGWPASLGAGAAVLVLGSLVYRIVFATLARFAAKTETTLDDILVRRMRTPARLLVVLAAVHVALVLRGSTSSVRSAVAVAELLLSVYLAIEVAETFVIHYWLGERQGVQVPAVVRHLLLVILYIVAVLSIIGSVTGVNVIPVLATSTVLTVVVGLALQDTLGNLLAGLAIHVEKPFEVGDWISVDGIEGQVVDMGWRSTRLRTFSWEGVSVPNAVIARARIHNFYAADKVCARNLEFLVTLAAAPEAVERAARAACDRVERIRKEPAPKVWLVGTTALFQRYVVKLWIDDFRFHDDIESETMKALWHTCRAEGVALEAAAPVAAADASGAAVTGIARSAPALDGRAP